MKSILLALLLVSGTAQAAAPCPASQADKPWLDRSLSAECRADALLATLHGLDERLAILAGELGKYGLEPSRASDGPAGPTGAQGATNQPNGLTIAASFDPALASRYGEVVAREFRAAGLDQMLGPTIDIARTWQSGRVAEGLGEDPHLAAALGAPMVASIQRNGVAALLKHYAIYTQEQGRTGDLPFGLNPAVNNIVSERVTRQLYLPPFRAAVEQGGALGAMCAFPRINGTYACENPWLLGILKKEWGMRGTVVPDFPDAQRSVVEAVNAGLDSGNFGLPPAGGGGHDAPPIALALGLDRVPGGVDLRTSVESGKVPMSRVDDMIRRRLIMKFAVEPAPGVERPPVTLGSPEAHAAAIEFAEQGAVLLKNARGLLPLGAQVRSIAVIGAQAGENPVVSTQGSSFLAPRGRETALEALRARAVPRNVEYAAGSLQLGSRPPPEPGLLRGPDGKEKLRVEYFAGPALRFDSTPLHVGDADAVLVVGPDPVAGLPPNNAWSARWTGTLVPRKTGLHTLTLGGAGSARLFLDGKQVAHFDRVDFGTVSYATLPLRTGVPVALRVEFTPREAAPLPMMPLLGTTLGLGLQLGLAEPDDRIAQAVAAARKADVAIVFAAQAQGEGADRTTLSLPGDQDQLIEAVARANPRTVVVLNTGGPVTMPWLSRVGAVLELWYPGEAFAASAARLLFGDAAPGGRLPVTFPASESEGLSAVPARYPGTVAPDGSLDEAHFDEGLLTGYRWYDAHGKKPLFAFGHGLTYSPVAITAPSVQWTEGTARVRATLANRGTRADSEVVQVYLSLPGEPEEPPKRLVAFSKVPLAAGESRTVELAIPADAFDLWDEQSHQWRKARGPLELSVGRSSDDIRARSSNSP